MGGRGAGNKQWAAAAELGRFLFPDPPLSLTLFAPLSDQKKAQRPNLGVHEHTEQRGLCDREVFGP